MGPVFRCGIRTMEGHFRKLTPNIHRLDHNDVFQGGPSMPRVRPTNFLLSFSSIFNFYKHFYLCPRLTVIAICCFIYCSVLQSDRVCLFTYLMVLSVSICTVRLGLQV